MRPRYLEFCGINSFSEPARIDFSGLLASGLFGIFGDTGSGKSTILDCISLALYGGTPRVRSGLADIINIRLDKAYVRFEFEIYFEGARRVFLIERELKRKNSAQTLKVTELCGNGEMPVRAEGVTGGEAFIKRVIGLEQRDFEKCISLPQGEFAQFVKAAPSERLKLVSRLFDLEMYGERLVKRANQSYRECLSALEVAKTRLEPYAQASAERNEALEKETAALTEEEGAVRTALAKARERAAFVLEQYKKRCERDKISRRLALLSEQEEEIASLERELSRMNAAADVCRAEAERSAAQSAKSAAEKAAAAAEEAREAAERLLEAASLWDEEGADGEIAALTVRMARAEQTAATQKRRAEIEGKLRNARNKYAEEKERFKDFFYEKERARLEQAAEALGGEGISAVAEEQIKAGLLRTEYMTFAGELASIREKYPETKEDVCPLEEKYAALSAASGAELGQLRSAFEEREKRRGQLQEERYALEQRNARYREHLQRLEQLQTEGADLREQLGALPAAEEAGNAVALERELLEKKREKKRRLEEREEARKRSAQAASACAAAAEKRAAAEERLGGAEERLRAALARGGFSSPEEAASLTRRFGDPGSAQARVKDFRTEYAALTARAKELSGDLSEGTEEAVALARREEQELENRSREVSGALLLKQKELSEGREALARKTELEKQAALLQRKSDVAERLKKLFEANKFMEFIAEEHLQNVTHNASARLLSLTMGKYFLRYNGGFFVGDNLNGGTLRGVHTLSGGEVFLVSLSLALALSEEICARSSRPMEFFFLDEGFGTLDSTLVDTVMDSLEKLRNEHFAIGIISHVEELKHRIEKKISVEKATDTHGSQIHA